MKRIVYFGLDPQRFKAEGLLTHYPLIQIKPRSVHLPEVREAFEKWAQYTHLLFTSRTAALLTLDWLKEMHQEATILQKKFIAIGSATAEVLPKVDLLAKRATAEGIVNVLSPLSKEKCFFFFPHSSLSRPVIKNFFVQEKFRFCSCVIYDTCFQALEPRPSFDEFDEFVFTSPSTVEAFVTLIGPLPNNKKLTAIGPITQKTVTKFLNWPSVNQ